MLARAQSSGALRINVLGSQAHNSFTNGGVETFDMAAQGRVDAFFLGGGQIDAEANINLVGTGEYPNVDVRWPGSFGSSYLYFLVPKVILFREEHSRRVFVPKVDFISAPGTSPPRTYRPGGPWKMLTSLGLFSFDRDAKRFSIESVHPHSSVEAIRDNTGFDIAVPPNVATTGGPDAAVLSLIRGKVRNEIAETYPQFANALLPLAS